MTIRFLNSNQHIEDAHRRFTLATPGVSASAANIPPVLDFGRNADSRSIRMGHSIARLHWTRAANRILPTAVTDKVKWGTYLFVNNNTTGLEKHIAIFNPTTSTGTVWINLITGHPTHSGRVGIYFGNFTGFPFFTLGIANYHAVSVDSVSFGQHHFMEAEAVDEGDGTVTLRVILDGVEIVNVNQTSAFPANISPITGTWGPDAFFFPTQVTYPNFYFIGDQYIADGPEALLGDVRVQYIQSNGNGFYNDSGGSFANVDEQIVDDGTSIVTLPAVGDRDTFTLALPSGTTFTGCCIIVVCRHTGTTSDLVELQGLMRVDGVDTLLDLLPITLPSNALQSGYPALVWPITIPAHTTFEVGYEVATLPVGVSIEVTQVGLEIFEPFFEDPIGTVMHMKTLD